MRPPIKRPCVAGGGDRLRVVVDNLLNVYSFSHEGTGGRGVLVLYAAHVVGGHLQAGDDAARWVPMAPRAAGGHCL